MKFCGRAAVGQPILEHVNFLLRTTARPSTRHFYRLARPPTHNFPRVLGSVGYFWRRFELSWTAGTEFEKNTYAIIFA